MAIKVDSIEDKDLYRGETRQKGITVSRSDGAVLTVSSATYRVYKTDGTALTEPADATIEGNGTAAVKVYANIAAGEEAGKRYVEFTYVIGSWTGKARLVYSVVV